ncbi:peptidoglycan DD-metalloendopeptidase family protein [Oscillochloris sp. ZM17-4]|nr:peptidoglycan DD-metalloendopeptidase family protein [Oscillochloris sp. ZM17-4]
MRSSVLPQRRSFVSLLCWLTALFALSVLSSPAPVSAAPQLILPTPPGEPWAIIQGYACGTHNAWDRYSLDLAQVGGPTYNAPIRAAAAGRVWHWEARSGTIILSHGGNFFTMYTHMARAVSTASGHAFEAGETLGYAGDRGAPGVPHLHFTAFTANSDGWSGKQSVPLSFAEGYDLPEVGGCSQHQGTVMTAASLQDPQISFSSPAQPDTWYNSDQRIEFAARWGGGGLSQSWDAEPAGDAPMFAGHTDGYATMGDIGEGMHTLQVRAWGPDGRQTLAAYGPVGYDITPPSNPPDIAALRADANTPIDVTWDAGADALSGVAGYRVYIGPDEDGSDAWFTEEPLVRTPPLAAGRYLVRVQTIDRAGNTSAWATIGAVTVE